MKMQDKNKAFKCLVVNICHFAHNGKGYRFSILKIAYSAVFLRQKNSGKDYSSAMFSSK
jgi:hypothetical protein